MNLLLTIQDRSPSLRCQLVSYSYPASIELTKGERKTVEVKVNSTEGYTPLVNLSAQVQDREIFPNFRFGNLTVPSYGIAGIPLTVSATNNAQIGPTTLLIFANSNFPSEELLKIADTQPVEPYNVISRSSIALFVREPPDWTEQISNVWSKIGDFTNFLYGIIAGLSPFIYTQVRKHYTK